MAGFDEAGAIAAEAVTAFRLLRSRPDLEWLDAAACLYEVPFSLDIGREREGTDRDPVVDGIGRERVMLRGSIDCLARLPDGRVIVVEIKTGRRRRWHQAQLDLYVRAARALFPHATVDGRLVYAG